MPQVKQAQIASMRSQCQGIETSCQTNEVNAIFAQCHHVSHVTDCDPSRGQCSLVEQGSRVLSLRKRRYGEWEEVCAKHHDGAMSRQTPEQP